MSLKVLLGAITGGVVLVIGGYFMLSPKVSIAPIEDASQDEIIGDTSSEEAPREDTTNSAKEETETASATETETPPISDSAPAPVPKQVSVPAPTPASPVPDPAPVIVSSPYTKSEVAKHANSSSCWSIINGSVYDLTAYIPKHPGGESRILKICGKDGTALFEDQHGGDSKPESILAKQRLGALQQ
jgi:cytochrome b involved in lipid metabolism